MSEYDNYYNAYWAKGEQVPQYRHTQALKWLMQDASTVLDIGCGDGLMLDVLRQQGKTAYGVDISEVAIQRCLDHGLHAERLEFADGKLPQGSWKTGLLLDVLEHLLNPDPLLTALHERVEEVIISVPNFNSLPARYQMLFGKVPENNQSKKGHVYWYNWSMMEQVLSRNGWRIIDRAYNLPLQRIPVLRSMIRWLAVYWPSVFSLSIMVRAKRV